MNDEEKRIAMEAMEEWISLGKPLRAFCRLAGMPAWRTVYDWMAADKDLAARVARARDMGFEALAQEALEIADTPSPGITVTEDEKGRKTVTEDRLGHRKLQIETRLKLLACWDPRRYGNKVEHNINETPDMVAAKIREALRVVADLDVAEGAG